MSLTGTAESGPVRVGVAIGDLTAGMWCAIGVLGALRVRDATGVGQKVETSLLGALVGLLSVQGQRYLSLGQVPRPTGNEHPVIAPYGSFRAADGENTGTAIQRERRIVVEHLVRPDADDAQPGQPFQLMRQIQPLVTGHPEPVEDRGHRHAGTRVSQQLGVNLVPCLR